MSSRSEGASSLLPILTYIVLPIGALVIVYYVVKNLVSGGGQAFIDLYKVQLEAYIKKMDQYAKENNGVLNPAQEASREDEQKAMSGTQANAAQAFNDPWKVIGMIGGVAVTVLGVVYVAKNLPGIISKWQPIFQNPSTQPKSASGVSKMMECVVVDQLAVEGDPVIATNFLSTVQNSWNTVDVPQMQAIMSSLQAQINAGILTGIELSIAQATISAYASDIAMMPSIFAIPLI